MTLLTALQNATTGTRELDARLWCEMSPTRRLASNADTEAGVVQMLSERDGHWRYATAPGLTTRPEGLRILMDYVQERWPEAYLSVGWRPLFEAWEAGIACDPLSDDWVEITHPTDPAIALAIAILRAEDSEDG